MEQKQVKAYWKKVRKRAFNKATGGGAIMALLITILVMLFATVLSGFLLLMGYIEYPFFRDNILANFITGISQVIVPIAILFIIYVVQLKKIPAEIHKEQEEKIIELEKEIENNFASPDIEISVLRLAEAVKNDGYRYASIVVKNLAESDIDNFCAVITGFEKQRITREEVSFMDEKNRSRVVGFDRSKWKNEIGYVNPGGNPIENEKNKEKITIGYKGGTARFNLVKGNGDKDIVVLNQGSPYSTAFGKEFKITLRFTGYLKEKPILPIDKIYRLSCSYKDDIKREGIRLIDFKEYDENEEEF